MICIRQDITEARLWSGRRLSCDDRSTKLDRSVTPKELAGADCTGDGSYGVANTEIVIDGPDGEVGPILGRLDPNRFSNAVPNEDCHV